MDQYLRNGDVPKEDKIKYLNQSVDQTRSTTTNLVGNKKLFAQEFYNLNKNKKRDLVGFSLHNHPSSQVEGVFSNWKASETSFLEQNQTPSLNLNVDTKLRKLQYTSANPRNMHDIKNQSISHRDMAKYAIGDKNSRQRTTNLDYSSNVNSQIRAGQGTAGLATTVLLPRIHPHELTASGQFVTASGQSQGSSEFNIQDELDQVQIQEDQYANRNLIGQKGQQLSAQTIQQVSNARLLSQVGHPLAQRYNQDGSNKRLSVPSNNERFAASMENLQGHFSNRSPRNNETGTHPLNQKIYEKRQLEINRVNGDLNTYLNMSKKTYGSNATLTEQSYGVGNEQETSIFNQRVDSLSGNIYNNSGSRAAIKVKQFPSKYNIKKSSNLNESAEKRVRHPDLKHNVKGKHLSISEQKLEMMARKAKVFQQKNLSQEQIEIYEKIKDRQPKNVDLEQFTLKRQRLVMQNNQQDKTKSSFHMSTESDKLRDTLQSQDSSPDPLDIQLGVAGITDVEGFQKKVQSKIDEMIDPKNVQIFTINQSKHLYQTIQKQAIKEREAKKRNEIHAQRKNKQFEPLSSQKAKLIASKNSSKERLAGNSQEANTPRKKSLRQNSRKQSKVSSRSNSVDDSSLLLKRRASQNSKSSPSRRGTTSNLRKSMNKNQSKVKDKRRPDYYKLQGKIDLVVLKKKLQSDLTQNLKLADQTGVLSILRNLHFDAKQKMQYMERKRMENIRKSQEVQQFPGYEERLDGFQDEIRATQFNQLKREVSYTEEVIGPERTAFFFGENSQVDMAQIFQMFQKEILHNFTQEQFEELMNKDEMIAFMSQIRARKVKTDALFVDGAERDLISYVKYLVGEPSNQDYEFKRDDFSQKHELNKNSLKQPFDEYAKQEENSMKTVANDIIERVDYSQVVQHIDEPIACIKYEGNPKYSYFNVCQQDSDLAIALLSKVVNRQLSLMNYQISVGHVKALTRTFDHNKQFINRFLFKNCGLTDVHNEILFNHMRSLERVISIVLKHEEFGQRSLQAIKPILVRPKPYDLQVLRLIDCRIPTQITRELIQTLREEGNNLKVLGLVNAKISDQSMQELGKIIAESNSMRDLDISWNMLKPQSYNYLIRSLGENRTLLTLNLSWNRIVDSTEIAVAETPRGKMRQSHTKLNSKATSKNTTKLNTPRTFGSSLNFQNEAPWNEKEVKFTDFTTTVIQNLQQLIKRNKKLQHLDLTGTGLTEFMMLKIGDAIARAKSLLSIHLCSNPGSTPRVKDFLANRIKCMPIQDIIKFPVGELIADLTNVQTKKTLVRQLSTGKEQDGEKPVARETIKIKQNMERKRIYSLVNEFADDNATDSRMIFTRILGHKMDMPGSGQWKLIKDRHEECWVCDQEVYGLIFWDADMIAQKAYMSTKCRHQETTMRSVIDQLHQVTSKDEEDAIAYKNPNSPIIMGDFTNWKPKPFVELVQYAESINQQFDADFIIQQMHLSGVLSYKVHDQGGFQEADWLKFHMQTAEFFERNVSEDWKVILQKTLLYKKPHLVFGSDTRDDFYRNLFMMATMFKVGKHEFIVRAPKMTYDRMTCEYVKNETRSGEPDYMYFTNVSDIRPEEVHPFLKPRNANTVVRYFNKEKSVFAPWKPQTAKIREDSFILDMENTKIATVLIKDKDDLAKSTAYLKENYDYIKECYLELQYHSVYPFINKLELASFAERSKLIDDHLNMAKCDLLYVSVMTNQRGGIKQKTGLIRCEFLEYVVRMAKFKYVDTNLVPTCLEALKLVIDKYMKPNFTPLPWQSFRDVELWTIEVNDVFETNLDGIQKLHQHYFIPTQKYMSDKDATNLLTKDVFADLTYTQAKYCLSFCKMILKDEILEFEKYHKLQLVELIEMIGRAAKVKYTATEYEDEPLARKIEMMLDLLFPLVRFKRREVAGGQESESASDDDY